MNMMWLLVCIGPFLLIALLQVLQILTLSKSVRLKFEADAGQPHPILNDSGFQALSQELQDLGFTPLGVMSEQALLTQTIKSPVLAWANGNTFATLARISGKLLYFFSTSFQDGEILLTANGRFGKIHSPHCEVQVIKHASSAQLLEAHQQRLQAFQSRGCQPVTDYSQQARLQASRDFYAHPAVQWWMGRNLIQSCLLSGGGLVLLIVILGGALYAWFMSEYGNIIAFEPPKSPPPTQTDQPSLKFSRLHQCDGSATQRWATFEVINHSPTTLQGARVLIEDKNRRLVLYGDAPGTAILIQGFQTSIGQCDRDEKVFLQPRERAYIELPLNTLGCDPTCDAIAQIDLCSDLDIPDSCIPFRLPFNIPPPN